MIMIFSNCDEQCDSALDNYKKDYYQSRTEQINKGMTEPLKLVKENLYRAKNAKTWQQNILIYHYLYHQWVNWSCKNQRQDDGVYKINILIKIHNQLSHK